MGAASRSVVAAMPPPGGLRSTQAMPRLLPMQPSVYRETTVRESPRPALHSSDFVQCRAREKYDLVLLRHNGLVAVGDRPISTLLRIVQPQFSAFKLARFSMEKVDERHLPGSDYFLGIIGVHAEEISVIARRDLYLGPCNWKFFDPELFQNSGQYSPNTIQDNLLMRSQFHQHTGPPVAVVCDSRFSARRNHFTVPELRFMLERVANQFFHFLRG